MGAPLAPRRFRFRRAARACVLGPVSAVPSPSWLGCRGVFFALLCFFFLAGCPCPGPCGPCPPIPFLSGWAAGSFFFFVVFVCLFRCPFSRWAAVPGLVLPVLAGWSPCAFLGVLSSVPSGGGGLAASGGVGGRFGGFGLFLRPPPSPLCCFFFGGGLPVPSSAFPGLAHALARIQCCLPGCCCLLRSFRPCSGPYSVGWAMYTVGSAPLLAGLGPGPAGWAAAPGGCLWLWVRGLELFVSFPLCGAGFNLLGGPPPLLPGALWSRVWPAVLSVACWCGAFQGVRWLASVLLSG